MHDSGSQKDAYFGFVRVTNKCILWLPWRFCKENDGFLTQIEDANYKLCQNTMKF